MGEVENNTENLIAKGTIFRGDIETEGPITIEGEIIGNIKSGSMISIKGGTVVGNLDSESVYMEDSKLVGDINASGSVIIEENSAMKGNINAEELAVSGTIKGDITVSELMSLSSTAKIVGEKIRCKTQTIEKGSVIKGCFMQLSEDEEILAKEEDIISELDKNFSNKRIKFSGNNSISPKELVNTEETESSEKKDMKEKKK